MRVMFQLYGFYSIVVGNPTPSGSCSIVGLWVSLSFVSNLMHAVGNREASSEKH